MSFKFLTFVIKFIRKKSKFYTKKKYGKGFYKQK
jgi:hypothetical protein